MPKIWTRALSGLPSTFATRAFLSLFSLFQNLVAGTSAPSDSLPVRGLLVSEAGEEGRDDPAGLGHEVVDVLRRGVFAEALFEQTTQVGQEAVHFGGIDADLCKGSHGSVELVADGYEDVAHVAFGDLGGAPHLQRRLHASAGVEQQGDGGGYVTNSANIVYWATSAVDTVCAGMFWRGHGFSAVPRGLVETVGKDRIRGTGLHSSHHDFYTRSHG